MPSQLVVYPGEGHGFDKPENQSDRDRRLLAWFQQYLPARPDSQEVEMTTFSQEMGSMQAAAAGGAGALSTSASSSASSSSSAAAAASTAASRGLY